MNDKTGNRRYWLIITVKGPIVKDMWDKNIEDEIDQVWAEAMEYYKNGEKLIWDIDEERDYT